MSTAIDQDTRTRLTSLAEALVDQGRATPIIPANEPREGFWFGAGNLSTGPDGALYLVGRYRNFGDSRTGLGSGTRGLELAIFRSVDGARSFSKLLSFSKPDLNARDLEVVSIEGAKLHFTPGGVELFVSTEKSGIPYPEKYRSFHKPGTGVWTIDRIAAASVLELAGKEPETILRCADPRWLHVKDPVIYDAKNGDTVLYFCTHPFNWSSGNTALAVRPKGAVDFGAPSFSPFPRGFTWDVAASRVTGLCPVPRVGSLARGPERCLVFYDGAESMRKYDEHPMAVKRPRGYSCEEIGGAACLEEGQFDSIERLSTDLPLFISPNGTGCSRYVDVFARENEYLVTWQQSQPDGSQPLVLNRVSRAEAQAILAG
ncbi:MAG TPA: exo-alpha-sialidase [Spirochaetia bacterium]|nr:exo-alpha-sialidase [Spirochaetia bacterium]